jgi:hypothetical protein
LRSQSTAVPLLAAALGMCGMGSACSQDAQKLTWQIAFDTPALHARAAVVEARIAKGGCKSEDIVYLSHFDPDKPGTTPPTLEHGIYGFVARAQDKSCRWFAYGCAQVTLPAQGGGPVAVHVSQIANEALDCDGPACHLLTCGSSEVDGGKAASPVVDAAVDEDAATPQLDAGMPLVTVAFEAESARPLRAPLVTIRNDSASGSTCIGYPIDPMQTLEQQQGQKRSMPPANDADGIAVYSFVVPRDDSYRLWGRVIAASVDEDSFWIQMDSSDFIQWNDIGHGDQWLWVDVRNFERRTEPYTFMLNKGRHTLRVSYRELGTLLDKLLLASDPTYIPQD